MRPPDISRRVSTLAGLFQIHPQHPLPLPIDVLSRLPPDSNRSPIRSLLALLLLSCSSSSLPSSLSSFFFPQRKVHYYCVCMMMTFFILLNCSYKIFSSYNPKRAFLHQLQYNPRAHSFLPLISSHARLAKDSLTTDPRARSTIFDTQLFALYLASQDIKFRGHCAQCLIPFPLSHTTDLLLAYPFPTQRRLLTIGQAPVCHWPDLSCL